MSPLLELTKTRRGLAHDGGQVAFQKPEEKGVRVRVATVKQSEKPVLEALPTDWLTSELSALDTSLYFLPHTHMLSYYI